ncbi:MAG: hypothetical protein JWM80_3096 [Cyanobacteria bacterium RYN_339]|nr:hypothetical protein [Cyanobacteria bacterium RYN_339]
MRRLLLLALLLTACAPYNQVACLPSNDALLILDDIAAGAGASKLKTITPQPAKTVVPFEVAGRKNDGDLYVSGTPQAGIVLTPGASTSGKDDERLVAFASSLARSGFAVLVPNLPNVRQLKVSPDDARVLADAMVFLASRADLAPGGRLGTGAFSYALGPTILAALEPDVRDKLRFVLGVGGYHDLTRVITYFTTGYFRDAPNQPWRYQKPNSYGKWAFVHSNVDRLTDEGDRTTFTEMANRKLVDPAATIDDLTAKLTSTEAKALLEVLNNTDPEKVPGLIKQLPAGVQSDLAKLTLVDKDLTPLKARMILFHGYEDDLVPYTESVSLAAAFNRRTRLFLINGFVHVDYKQPGFLDGWSFGCAIQDVLNEKWKSATDF